MSERTLTYRQAVAEALAEEMRRDPDVFLMGEDVGRHGGAFAASKGLRSTRQRDSILDVFLATRQHVSVEELYLKVKASNPGVGQATVYRTLKLFVEAGLAREILLQIGAVTEAGDPISYAPHVMKDPLSPARLGILARP